MMLGMLVVLGMLIARAGDPNLWRWLTDEPATPDPAAAAGHAGAPTAVPAPVGSKAPPDEPHGAVASKPSPRDDDPAERQALRRELEAVSDRDSLGAEEMPAYWRMLAWSRSQPFAELAARARADVAYTQLWQGPSRHRGELLRLRLHVVRVLALDPTENKYGLTAPYELWGWTDDSKSFPYVAVVSELPSGVTVGADVRHEVTFAGYFLKLLSYEAFDKSRAAPLLLGRAEHYGDPAATPAARREDNAQSFLVVFVLGAFGLAGAAIGGAIATYRRRRRGPSASTSSHPAESPTTEPAATSCDADAPYPRSYCSGHAAMPPFPS
jgi:hypothetical protein